MEILFPILGFISDPICFRKIIMHGRKLPYNNHGVLGICRISDQICFVAKNKLENVIFTNVQHSAIYLLPSLLLWLLHHQRPNKENYLPVWGTLASVFSVQQDPMDLRRKQSQGLPKVTRIKERRLRQYGGRVILQVEIMKTDVRAKVLSYSFSTLESSLAG